MEKGKKVIDEIKANTKRGKLTLIEMELDSMVSIKKGAEAFLAQSKTLNILINNAGFVDLFSLHTPDESALLTLFHSVMATPEGQTKDGFETQFGTDHLGHFYLFQLLKPTLLASSTPVFPSRVVSASSIGHRQSRIRPDDHHFHQVGSYNPWLAYGQAKTANILFANEVERRYGARGLHTTSLHPGGIMTGLQAHVDPAQKAAWDSPVVRNYMKDAAQGAATSVYAALSAEWAGKGGRYWINCVEQTAFAEDDGEDFYLGDDGYQTWAYDEEMERRLWKYSLRLVGLSDDQ